MTYLEIVGISMAVLQSFTDVSAGSKPFSELIVLSQGVFYGNEVVRLSLTWSLFFIRDFWKIISRRQNPIISSQAKELFEFLRV